ncbi:hypothetical protein [Solibacillus cecembensis]|uniref:hypothetical protein n=1 Tax=Solibacillus cecembensis TaxID=459347 RepID=UPI003D05B016
MINLLNYDKEYDGWIEVKGEYVAYAVSGEADDYVEQTSKRMRQLAQAIYTFPFYFHFESYDDSPEWILQEKDFDIRYKTSGRTVLTQIGRKTFQAEVPTFTVVITNQVLLNQAFKLWFLNAFDNHLWALTQEDNIYYENGFAAVDLTKDMTILVTEHDAFGFTVVTNEADYQSEPLLRAYLEKVISGW